MKMTPHTKIAIVIAPFLLIGGYIAADYYKEITAAQKNLFQLEVQGTCDIIASQCVLKHDRLTLNITDQQGITQILSNHALDTAAISIVKDDKELQYQLKTDKYALKWQASTALAALSADVNKQKIRIIVTLNKGYYYSELSTMRGSKYNARK
ncbi:MAG: hypothetical protein QM479_08720 [Pseudomonadota bacterium]